LETNASNAAEIAAASPWLDAAILAAGVSFLTAIVTAYLTSRSQEKRLRTQLKLEHSVEAAIIELLGNRGWEMRSFKTIKHHIRGFEDDELRRFLVRAGAVAFQQQPSDRKNDDPHRDDPEKLERWGLLVKNRHNLDKANP
jgi:predicted membrane-bound mannosyltransferase